MRQLPSAPPAKLVPDTVAVKPPLVVVAVSVFASPARPIVRAVIGRKLELQPLQVVFTAHLASVLRTMVLDGRGLAWLPETLVGEDLDAGRLAAAAPVDWNVPVEIRLYRERRQASPAAERFWASALEQ